MFFVVQAGRVDTRRTGTAVFLATHAHLRFATREEAVAAAEARYAQHGWLVVHADHARDAFLTALDAIRRDAAA